MVLDAATNTVVYTAINLDMECTYVRRIQTDRHEEKDSTERIVNNVREVKMENGHVTGKINF